MRTLAALVLLMSGPAAPALAVEISPIYGLQILGGQYFNNGEKGTLSGNATALAAPALRLSDTWSVLPSLQSSYQGTKSVVDLVGAGTLFQEQMDHRLSARAVYSPAGSAWRFKPSAAYRRQFLKETVDEEWGKGLFDYSRVSVGGEAEYVFADPYGIRAGLDYYDTRFPNYVSLESRSPGLARELAGARVLDTRSFAFSMGVNAPVKDRAVLEGGLNLAWHRYPQQMVVSETGALLDNTRDDVVTQLALSARMPAEFNTDLRLLGSLDLACSFASSDQNSYDASAARYFALFYNYREVRVSPGLKVLVGPPRQPVTLGMVLSGWVRRYPHRVAQDATGAYTGAQLDTRGWLGSATLSYPMAKHFALLFNVQYGQASSNQRYEQLYRYNYSVANYLFGFSYDY